MCPYVSVSDGGVLPKAAGMSCRQGFRGLWPAGSDGTRGCYCQEHTNTQILRKPRSLHVEGSEGTLMFARLQHTLEPGGSVQLEPEPEGGPGFEALSLIFCQLDGIEKRDFMIEY